VIHRTYVKYSMLIAYRNSHILLRRISRYANTEVLRDLTDEYRYNLLVPVANSLGIDPNMNGKTKQ
jgi:hypothetical protein